MVDMNEVGRFIAITFVTGLLASFAANTTFAQAGSTGGTLGKQDKSISGGQDSAPIQTNPPQHTSTQPAVTGHVGVTSATLGRNCGAPPGNVTAKVAAICDGKETCSLSGSMVNSPDPAFGCPKSFAAEWRCGNGSRIRSNSVPAVPLEGNILTLSCK
jgi:hypothetical protein